MEAILDAGAPYTSGPQWLAEQVLPGRHVLAVAGTHGKTTTTSMLAWILDQAGLQPGFLVGGVPLNFGVSARLGRRARRRPFVIEADEYDTAFFDKRSKFVHYRPRTAILNNLELDHADIFPDLGAIETQFHHLVRTVPASGRLVVNARDEALQRVLARGCWSEVQRFGTRKEEPGGLRARGEPHAFDVLRGSLKIAPRRLAAARRAQPAQRAGRDRRGRACGRGARGRRRGAGQLRERAPPARAARRGRRRQGLRRLRAPPDRDAQPPSTACAARSGCAAHPGRLRAALQHHEAGHDEGPAALGAGRGRPELLPAGRLRLERARSAGADGRAGGGGRLGGRAGGAGGAGGAAGRPCAVHEQRRLRRHPRQAARRRWQGRAAVRRRRARRHATCSTCTASARRPSRSRRSGCRPGWPRTGPTCTGGARSCRRRRARRWTLVREGTAGWPAASSAVLGSSLGGFYATVVAEATGWPAVLLNPAVDPARDLAAYVGELSAFHTPERALLLPRRVRRRTARAEPGRDHPARALLRHHRQGRRGARLARDDARATPARTLRLLEGSDHALSDFDDHLPTS